MVTYVCVYMCGVYECVLAKARRGRWVSCFNTLHLIPLRQGLSVSLGLACQIVSPNVLSLRPQCWNYRHLCAKLRVFVLFCFT